MISPKIEIINHFDNLTQRVDIDIEECLTKYNQEQVLGDLSFFKTQERNFKMRKCYQLNFFDNSSPKSSESSQRTDLYSESTKVVDYLNQIRMRTIEELRKAQEETFEHYKLNKTSNNQLIDEEKSQTFYPDKFYFQVLFKQSNEANWIFNLFTFVTDFYLSPVYIGLFEKLINAEEDKDEFLFNDFEIIFNEKLVLIGLLKKYFFENLQTENYPRHVIRVSKKDTLNIKQIKFLANLNGVNLNSSSTIDLSNLENLYLGATDGSEELVVNIEGLSSLQVLRLLNLPLEPTSLKRLNTLRELGLIFSKTIKLKNLSYVIEYLPNIEKLTFSCDSSYINLESLVNLKSLRLLNSKSGFNFDVFKNISHKLEEIVVFDPFKEINYEPIEKLLLGHQFPKLINLAIIDIKVHKIEKKFFAGFPMLQKLRLTLNEIRLIDNDAFSNMKQLISLNLSNNCIESIKKSHFSDLIKLKNLKLNKNRIKRIDENVFSSLKSLLNLDLSSNQLTSLDPKSFASLGNLKSLDLKDNQLSHFDLDIIDSIRRIEKLNLSGNPIDNKDEILNRFNGSKIKFLF